MISNRGMETAGASWRLSHTHLEQGLSLKRKTQQHIVVAVIIGILPDYLVNFWIIRIIRKNSAQHCTPRR